VHSAVKHSAEYLTGMRGPRPRSRIVCSVDRNPDGMAWVADASPTGNLLTYEAFCALKIRMGHRPPSASPHEFALRAGIAIDRLAGLREWNQCVAPI
jgi:hypothetical protein